MPLLIGLNALALGQLAVIVLMLILGLEYARMIGVISMFWTLLVLLFWVGVIAWEQKTGKRWR